MPELPQKPPDPRRSRFTHQFAVALELPFVIVGTVLIGGGAGYFLDRWLGTSPLFLLVLGALGFYAGVRDIQRRLHMVGKGTRKNG